MSTSFIKMKFPNWFRVFILICASGTTILAGLYLGNAIKNSQLLVHPLKSLIFFALIFSSFWIVLKLLFYSLTVTNDGLIVNNIICSKKFVRWDEVVQIRRPIFRVPLDATYIILANGKKVLLVRSMENYKEVIQAIKAKISRGSRKWEI